MIKYLIMCLTRVIYTTRQIPKTLYFSLGGVDAIQGLGLRGMFGSIFGRIGYDFVSGVDLAAKTLTGYRLLDELFPLAGKTT